MSIRVHIEHLIVDGITMSASGAIDLQAAMQHRLTQLLTEQGVPDGLGKTTWIDSAEAPPIAIGRRVDGATLGDQAAEALRVGLAGHVPSRHRT